jgi:hypothetical protein
MGTVQLCGSNLSLADTSVVGGVHLPFTYNALRGLLLPSGYRSAACIGYAISVLFLGNISVPQKAMEKLVSVWGGGGATSWSHKGALYQHLLLVQSPY